MACHYLPYTRKSSTAAATATAAQDDLLVLSDARAISVINPKVHCGKGWFRPTESILYLAHWFWVGETANIKNHAILANTPTKIAAVATTGSAAAAAAATTKAKTKR